MKEGDIIYLKKGRPLPILKNRRDSGIIAFGGDLSFSRLLEAYSKGIFPWYDVNSPILWHSPMERCIFNINSFKTSHSLKQKLKNGTFSFTFDQCFVQIMQCCALIKRKGESGTWIFRETVDAYSALHMEGYAHSLEVWHKGEIAGGLFGVSLGKAFFGESMFHVITDASKAAMYFLFEFLRSQQFHFVDAQMHTDHLISLGAEMVSRNHYLQMLEIALKNDTIAENWDEYIKRRGITPEFYGRGYKNVRTKPGK
ncbi:MAG TPA: leucyl/phenylalanyl-tRNA--protein transferase [Lentimicrobium sp.]|nr:leucyl/phenylalanyl-tRNA--protein transferase [Lentimicrobium sp.]